MNKRKIKPFILPAAIILGLVFHNVCGMLSAVVPYLIFTILILTFSTTNLRGIHFKKLDLYLMLIQSVGSVGLYLLMMLIFNNQAIADGIMLACLCPVASSVTVVAMMLGARQENTVAYTIFGNLLVCVLAPVLFIFIGNDTGGSLTDAFFSIFGRIATAIGLPFFIMLCVQLWAPRVSDTLCRYNGVSFYLWACALLLTLGQTIDFIYLHGAGHWNVIIVLAIGSAVLCPLQFYIGRLIGRRNGDAIAGQQLLAQKNTAIGIWMSNTYLNPLASTFLAFYSVWQNTINSWQIWRRERKL